MYAEKTDYDDIEMSSRLRNILRRNGFESLEGLREYPKEHFIKFRNMGQATLQELYQICEEQGIKLRSVEDLNDREHGVIFDDFLCLDAFGMGIKSKDTAQSLKAACTMLSLIFQLRKVIAMKKYNGKELYKGLLFIKSMMSMNNVNRQKELDQTYALSVGIECDQTVVDDGASTSVDRPQMRQLMEILEISDYKVLVVEDIYEITRNPEDLKSMMDRINDLGVTIFDLGTMSARYNNYAIEC